MSVAQTPFSEGVEALYREETLHRILSLLGLYWISCRVFFFSSKKKKYIIQTTPSIKKRHRNSHIRSVESLFTKNVTGEKKKYLVFAASWRYLQRHRSQLSRSQAEQRRRKKMVSWCNRHCITNYTASLSINRKLHSSDRKKKNRPQFVQNCTESTQMSKSGNLCSQRDDRDLRLLHSCLHVQVFVPFRYALHVSSSIFGKNSSLFWGWNEVNTYSSYSHTHARLW